MTKEQIAELVREATAVRRHAYAPFSGYTVGAAVLADDGRVFCGANVENSSYGLSLCAERVALGAAVSAGVRAIVAVAVATEDGATPCGACRQSLLEFGDEMEVLLVSTAKKGLPRRVRIETLLPEAFRFRRPQ